MFADGAITIQDESSQLVAPTLDLQGDERVLDACAAPGGKTAHIASYLTTGQVTALDLYDHKLDLIQENAQRLGVEDRVQTQKLDARKVHEFLTRIPLIRFWWMLLVQESVFCAENQISNIIKKRQISRPCRKFS